MPVLFQVKIMLQKKYRLKKYSAFIATYRVNNVVSDKNLCIYFGKEKTDVDVYTKFAFVVSKKIHKRAVVRNRIKRLMRESVRKIINKKDNDFLNNYLSVIFVAKKTSIGASFSDIDSSITELLASKSCK